MGKWGFLWIGLILFSEGWGQENWVFARAESLAVQELERVRPYLVQDHPYLEWIRKVFDRIEQLTGYNIRFNIYLIRNEVPAAYAFLRNSIYVTTGLIKIMDLESDSLPLLFVLCHEASHILLRHIQSTVNLSLLAERIRAQGGGLQALNLGFRRELEMEADRYAVFLLLRMGVPLDDAIRAGQEALKRIDRIQHSTPLQAQQEAHPTTNTRRSALYEVAAQLTRLADEYERFSELLISGVPFYYDSAAQVYHAVLEIFPQDIGALNNLACAYILKGLDFFQRIKPIRFADFLFVNATPQFLNESMGQRRGLETKGENRRWWGIGRAYMDSARQVLYRVLNLRPTDLPALAHLSVLYRILGEYARNSEQAVAWYDSAYTWGKQAQAAAENWKGPERSYVLSRIFYNIGGILYTAQQQGITVAEGEVPEQYFSEAKRLAPYLHEARYYLALYYEQTGKHKKAKEAWRYLLHTAFRTHAQAHLKELAFTLQPRIREGIRGVGPGSQVQSVRSALGPPDQEFALSPQKLIWSYGWGSVVLEVIQLPGALVDTVVHTVVVQGQGMETDYGIKIPMQLNEVLQRYQIPGLIPSESLYGGSPRQRSFVYPTVGGGYLILTFISQENSWHLSEIRLSSSAI